MLLESEECGEELDTAIEEPIDKRALNTCLELAVYPPLVLERLQGHACNSCTGKREEAVN